MNDNQVKEIVAMWRYRYSPYTIACTLDLEPSAVERVIQTWEESQIPAGGGKRRERK